MQYIIENFRNNFNFFLRNLIIFSRKNYFESPQDLSDIFENNEQENLYETLKNKYGTLLSQNATRRIFLLNLYYLNLFDKSFSKKTKDNVSVLDIGSKNWEYVKSEYVFFKSFINDFILNGIELDAYRMCSNFYNRYEIARFYIKGLQNVNYIQGDFVKHQQKYDYIIFADVLEHLYRPDLVLEKCKKTSINWLQKCKKMIIFALLRRVNNSVSTLNAQQHVNSNHWSHWCGKDGGCHRGCAALGLRHHQCRLAPGVQRHTHWHRSTHTRGTGPCASPLCAVQET